MTSFCSCMFLHFHFLMTFLVLFSERQPPRGTCREQNSAQDNIYVCLVQKASEGLISHPNYRDPMQAQIRRIPRVEFKRPLDIPKWFAGADCATAAWSPLSQRGF